MTNALPLIPPTGALMTLKACEAERARLRAIHDNAIVSFWANLKTYTMSDHWGRVELDLFNLKKQQDAFDQPGHEYLVPIWEEILTELDDEAIQEKLKIETSAWLKLDLVAVITEEDGSLTVVHRYEGERIYSSDDGILDIGKTEGAYWFYSTSAYEPSGYDEGSYTVPSLYLIGSVGNGTAPWMAKHLAWPELIDVKAIVDDMESLRDRGELPTFGSSPHLPAFPSGVESRLQELELLRNHLYQVRIESGRDEKAAVCLAGQPFEAPIADLNAQMQAIRELLDVQVKLKHVAEKSAFLAFHGYECGQVVTNPITGETGVLAIPDDCRGIIVQIEGKTPEGWSTRHRLESELSAHEWTVVPVDGDSTGSDRADLCPAP